MDSKSAPWSVVLLLTLLLTISTAEDSLRSALNAVTRRQRDLSDLSRYGDYYNEGYDDDELGFINPSNNYGSDSRNNMDFEKNLMDYIEENGMPDINRDDFTKRISSSFRERVEEDKERQRKKMAEFLLNKLENEREMQENEEYEEFLHQLWNKYRRIYPNSYDAPNVYQSEDIKKRDYYPSLGWESVGMRKRSRYFEPDGPSESLYLLNYAPREEFYNKLQEERDISDPDEYYGPNKFSHRDRKYDVNVQLPYMTKKRFPVTKRSSNYYTASTTQKRSTKKEMALKTDPKVAEELSNIFSAPKETSSTNKSKKTIKKTETTAEKPKKKLNNTTDANNKPKIDKKKENKQPDKHGDKEVPDNVSKEKPLQIKKKSINWSDYFGLDKRKKKNDNNGLDNEWLMERYHKAIAMATKRNADHPLQNIHNHETKKDSSYEDKKNKSGESKINDMDTKLKNIEDSIIDEALKFTGAHEGTVDSKEIQEVKDKVMSRLAAAYNLEKMRRALDEYRMSVEKERSRMKEINDDSDDYSMEVKRVSVPRKQAIDEDREKTPESDNNIKCTQNDEDCDEQNYKVPSELIDRSEWDIGKDCPKVQRACNEVSSVLGHHGRVFETACNIHQICLLCGENSWFAPTRRCNVLFLSKANELCEDDVECQNVARRSVRYLLDINRSLRAEPLGDCELVCPENR